MNAPTGAQAPVFPGVHLRAAAPRADGNFLAVTVFDKGRKGVTVWAGYVVPGCAARASSAATNPDFVITERLSVMFRDDIARYFKDREVGALVDAIFDTARLGRAS